MYLLKMIDIYEFTHKHTHAYTHTNTETHVYVYAKVLSVPNTVY